MRSDDVQTMDYFRGLPATNIGATTAGQVVSLLGMSGFSCTLFTGDGAKANVVFQFSDFSGRTRNILPTDPALMMTSDITQAISGTAGTPTVVRVARFSDQTCAASNMRIVFTPTTGSTGTLYAALTLRAQ